MLSWSRRRLAGLMLGLAAAGPCLRASASTQSAPQLGRRGALALVAGGLLAVRPAPAPAAGFFGVGGPNVELLRAPQICQSRTLANDFVKVRYTAKIGGVVVDDRYATTPLVYQLGAFFVPGMDEALEGRCVQSDLRFTWTRPPSIDWGVRDVPLPAGPLVIELNLERVVYDALKEKMVRPNEQKLWAQAPLTASSPVETRWYPNDRAFEPPGQTLLEFFELAT